MARHPAKPRSLPKNATEWQRAIFAFLEETKISVAPWAKASGVSEGTVRKALSLSNYGMSSQTFAKLSSGAFRLTGRSLTVNPSEVVPLTGRVGAGAIVHMFIGDVAQSLNEFVPYPEMIAPFQTLGALTIEGDSMPPLEDGWLVYYRREHDGISQDEIGKLCVIQLRDGRVYLKKLNYGSRPGRFNLKSFNGNDLLNEDVEWATRVIAIVPK